MCVCVCERGRARACVNVSVCVRAGGDKVISSSVLVPDFNRCQSLHKKKRKINKMKNEKKKILLPALTSEKKLRDSRLSAQ